MINYLVIKNKNQEIKVQIVIQITQVKEVQVLVQKVYNWKKKNSNKVVHLLKIQ